jgi:hypothetical protein
VLVGGPANVEHLGLTAVRLPPLIASSRLAAFNQIRHREFLDFLKQVAKTYPRHQLHVVVDNYATHKHPTVGPGCQAPTGSVALHPDLGVMAQPGRGVLRDHHAPGAPSE